MTQQQLINPTPENVALYAEQQIKPFTTKRLHACLDRLVATIELNNSGYGTSMYVYWRDNNYHGKSLAIMNCSREQFESLRWDALWSIGADTKAELKALGSPRTESMGLDYVTYFEKVRMRE